MSRRVSVDLDPSRLTREAVHALRVNSDSDNVWLPLERHSRDALAPVVVRDADGQVVPRLTGLETSRAVASGLVRLFGLLVDGHPDSSTPGTPIHQMNTSALRSRWLIESAIVRLVESSPTSAPATGLPPATSATKPTDPDQIRRTALSVVNQVAASATPFAQLLKSAASEYFLVAQVRIDAGETFLDYEAPLLRARAKPRLARYLSASWLPIPSSEFTVRYDSMVPRGVDSYHITIEVPAEILLRRFTVSSDADQPIVDELKDDLAVLQKAMSSTPASPDKIHELELQRIASRIAELGDGATQTYPHIVPT